jgi:tau tubulin kinase
LNRKGIQEPKQHVDESEGNNRDENNSVASTDANNNLEDFGPSQHITMTSEDLLQPGHVVKERWKVVSP